MIDAELCEAISIALDDEEPGEIIDALLEHVATLIALTSATPAELLEQITGAHSALDQLLMEQFVNHHGTETTQ